MESEKIKKKETKGRNRENRIDRKNKQKEI